MVGLYALSRETYLARLTGKPTAPHSVLYRNSRPVFFSVFVARLTEDGRCPVGPISPPLVTAFLAVCLPPIRAFGHTVEAVGRLGLVTIRTIFHNAMVFCCEADWCQPILLCCYDMRLNGDRRITNRLLYQLSYGGLTHCYTGGVSHSLSP